MTRCEWNVAMLGARMDNAVSEALDKSGLLLNLYTALNRSNEYYSRSMLYKLVGLKIPRRSNVAAKNVHSSLLMFILAKFLRKINFKNTDLSRNEISNTINKRFAKFCVKKILMKMSLYTQ